MYRANEPHRPSYAAPDSRGPSRRAARHPEGILRDAIPLVFQHDRPKNEAGRTAAANAVLAGCRIEFESEYPYIRSALATSNPDWWIVGTNLLIETEDIRAGTPPSKVTEGISGDLRSYPEGAHPLFIVFDPGRAVARDDVFKRDQEARENRTVRIIRCEGLDAMAAHGRDEA